MAKHITTIMGVANTENWLIITWIWVTNVNASEFILTTHIINLIDNLVVFFLFEWRFVIDASVFLTNWFFFTKKNSVQNKSISAIHRRRNICSALRVIATMTSDVNSYDVWPREKKLGKFYPNSKRFNVKFMWNICFAFSLQKCAR